MAGATAVNTVFSPRQPGITLSASVLQLLIAPSGLVLARILPDQGLYCFGKHHPFNPGFSLSRSKFLRQ